LRLEGADILDDVDNDFYRRDDPGIDVAEATSMIKEAGVTEYVGAIETAGTEGTSEAGSIN